MDAINRSDDCECLYCVKRQSVCAYPHDARTVVTGQSRLTDTASWSILRQAARLHEYESMRIMTSTGLFISAFDPFCLSNQE